MNETKRIKALKTFKYAENGHTVIQYTKGEEYEVSPECLAAGFEMGAVEEVGAKKLKNQESAPENKAKKSAPRNK